MPMDTTVEISGPWWPRYELNVGGFVVPHLTITPPMNKNNEPAPLEDDRIFLSLDHRIGIYTTRDELMRWIGFIADCMAVANGYPCFGATEKMPFAKKASTSLGEIRLDKPTLTIVETKVE